MSRDIEGLVKQLTPECKSKGVTPFYMRNNGLWFECRKCTLRWPVDTPEDREPMPNGYWKCPNGCNDDAGVRAAEGMD